MKLHTAAILVWLLAILALTLTACGGCGDDDDNDNNDTDDDDNDDDQSPDDDDSSPDDDDDDDDNDTSPSPADPFCDAGKELLRAGAGGLAAEQFYAGLDLDENAVNCRYGLLLADSLREFDTISIIVSYVAAFIEGYQPPVTADWPQTGQGFIDELLNRILGGLYFTAADEAIVQTEWLRENRPDVIYPLDRMPIILNFEEVADPHGDYDLPDAVSAEAFAGISAGLLKHLVALNLDFELGIIFEIVEADLGSYPLPEMIGILVDYLIEIFDSPLFPDFFTLKEDGALFQQAGLQAGLGFRTAAETYDLLTAETEPQTAEVLGYADQNANEQWDENEPLVIPPWGALDAESDAVAWAFAEVFSRLADSFLDYTDFDTNPEEPQPFYLAYLNPLIDAFGLPPLIPDWDFLVIDFGAAYVDVDPTALRDAIVLILNLLNAFLP